MILKRYFVNLNFCFYNKNIPIFIYWNVSSNFRSKNWGSSSAFPEIIWREQILMDWNIGCRESSCFICILWAIQTDSVDLFKISCKDQTADLYRTLKKFHMDIFLNEQMKVNWRASLVFLVGMKRAPQQFYLAYDKNMFVSFPANHEYIGNDGSGLQ